MTTSDVRVAGAVLSGNRNFEGRVHQQVRANFLASPPLVVAYALARGQWMEIILATDPLGNDADGNPVYLKDIWPTNQEIHDTMRECLTAEMYRARYDNVFEGPQEWQAIDSVGPKPTLGRIPAPM